jgi:hypothetical protein
MDRLPPSTTGATEATQSHLSADLAAEVRLQAVAKIGGKKGPFETHVSDVRLYPHAKEGT